jgi:hypothetical protein
MNQATVNQTPTTIHNTDVTAALDAILNTDKFAASPQMSAFLRYVVEQTLIGNTRRIKAFTVGIEALGKPASFDPQTDPSVRVLAKRLRSSLDTYYLQNPDTPIFIEMKPGSYIPKFLLRSEMQQADSGGSYAVSSPVSVQAAYRPTADGPAPATDRAAGVNHTAPLSAQKQQELAASASAVTGRNASDEAVEDRVADTSEGQSSRQSSISQLWQAYKSASKVA